ncbi:uncharacterized protein LOC141907748 [Tubulanus polymorphus]|uniref:uncharacterized protein LOC141907748 n=1 Tax=Tubulanus polymorphus TaxID=672921 RepID=UPI003DA36F67
MSSTRRTDGEGNADEGPKKKGSKIIGCKSKSSGLANSTGCNTGNIVGTKKKFKEAQYSFYSTDSENDVAKAHKDLDRCAKILSELMPKEQAFPRGVRTLERKKKVMSKTEQQGRDTIKDNNAGKQTNRMPIRDVVTPRSPCVNVEVIPNQTVFNQVLTTSTPDRKDNLYPAMHNVAENIETYLNSESRLQTANSSQTHLESTLPTAKDALPSLNHETFKIMADKYFRDKFQCENGFEFERMMHDFFQSQLLENKLPQSVPVEQPVRDTDVMVTIPGIQPLPVISEKTVSAAKQQHYSRNTTSDMEANSNIENIIYSTGTKDLAPPVVEVEDPSKILQLPYNEFEDADTTLCYEGDNHSTILPSNNNNSEIDNAPVVQSSSKSCAEVRGQYHTLKYLIQELRATVNKPGDAEVNRIIEQVESTASMLSPVKSAINFQAEVERAIDPIRDENVQLRRRLRIVNQQLKEKERIEKTGCDPAFELIHLQTENANLREQLQDEQAKLQKFSDQIYVIEKSNEKLTTERQHLLLLLNQKDTDHMKTRHDWVQEVTRLKKELEAANNRNEMQKIKLEAAEREGHILKTSINQRDVELSRLQELLQSCKGKFGVAPEGNDSQLLEPQPENQAPIPGPLTREALEEFNRNTSGSSKRSIHSSSPIFNAADYFQLKQQKSSSPPGRSRDVISPLREIPSNDNATPKISPSARYKQTIIDLKMKAAMFNEERGAKSCRSKSSASDSGTEVSGGHSELSQAIPNNQKLTGSNADISQASANSCRYSVTEYFRKYPVDRFYNGHQDDGSRVAADTTFDDESVISDLTVTSVSTIRSSDDRSFRENLESLDANISRIQQTLIRK